jgi:hypothetical protein
MSTLRASTSSISGDCGSSLRDDPDFVSTLSASIENVNRMLPKDSQKLGLLNGNPDILNDLAFVPVSSVRASRSNAAVAQVPRGCREIILDGTTFFELFSHISSSENSLIKGHEVDMISLILLHELGHIQEGHHGAFLPTNKKSIINLEENTTKEYESAADAIVAKILIQHVDAIDSGKADTGAIMLVAFLSTLSFEIGGQTMLNCLFCRHLGSKQIFWDHSYSHENLEYRLLKLSHEISPNSVSKGLLEDYENQRNKPAGMWVIGEDGNRSYIYENSEEFKQFQDFIESLPSNSR